MRPRRTAQSSPRPAARARSRLGTCDTHIWTHWQRQEDLVHQMHRHLAHAPCVARGAHRAALARKRDQKIVSALPAAGVGEDAAFQVEETVTCQFVMDRSQ